MRIYRSRVVAALATLSLLFATACGGGSGGSAAVDGVAADGASQTPVAESSGVEPADTTSAAATSGTTDGANTGPSTATSTGPESSPGADADGAIDALAATGPVVADVVPDMQPVAHDAQPRLPATVTDADGASVTITSADRIIALDLYGTLTDTVIGLGLGDRLVGRGVSDKQESLKDLPVVSLGGIDLNVEAVLGLKPDLVLTNMTIGSAARYQQIEAAGVTVVRFEKVPSIADIRSTTHDIGAVFGMASEADQLAAHIEEELAAARATVDRLRAATPRQPRAAVVYVRGSGGIFFIFGADYGVSDILSELHLEDVATEAGITSLAPANPESLIALDPEIVLTMKDGMETAGGVQGLLGRPGMSATTAGANRRIIIAEDSQLLSYGPRTPGNLVALATAIYTDGSGS